MCSPRSSWQNTLNHRLSLATGSKPYAPGGEAAFAGAFILLSTPTSDTTSEPTSLALASKHPFSKQQWQTGTHT